MHRIKLFKNKIYKHFVTVNNSFLKCFEFLHNNQYNFFRENKCLIYEICYNAVSSFKKIN